MEKSPALGLMHGNIIIEGGYVFQVVDNYAQDAYNGLKSRTLFGTDRGRSVMKTRITELLGIKYPIIQSPMNPVSFAPLVAAVCNAGGLGILAGGGHMSPEDMRKMIKQTKELTDKPFGANFVAFSPTGDEARDAEIRARVAAVIQVLIEEKVAVASYGRGDPKMITDTTHPHGMINMPTIGAVKHATRAEGYGVDAVIIQGLEAGGHASFVSTLVQVPQVVDAIKLPVVASGGFCDDRGLVAALALGAEGIAMGTRFLVTKESTVPDETKQWYLRASDHDTVITPHVTGVRCRMLHNKLTDRIDGEEQYRPLLHQSGGRAKRVDSALMTAGDADMSSLYSGQVVGRCNDIPTCKELIDRIVYGAEEILERVRSSIR